MFLQTRTAIKFTHPKDHKSKEMPLLNICLKSVLHKGCAIDGSAFIRCQFHQHFMRAFFDNILAPKNCKAKQNLKNLLNLHLYEKRTRKMLMKLTQDRTLIRRNVNLTCKCDFAIAIFFNSSFEFGKSAKLKRYETQG
jgi:hypothetical protein